MGRLVIGYIFSIPLLYYWDFILKTDLPFLIKILNFSGFGILYGFLVALLSAWIVVTGDEE
jgi:hypothetical protein